MTNHKLKDKIKINNNVLEKIIRNREMSSQNKTKKIIYNNKMMKCPNKITEHQMINSK